MTEKNQKDEEFRPREKDIGILKEITGKNQRGLEKLGKEEKSKAFRERNKYIRKVFKLYRRYFKNREATTQTIKA
jgi:hypothetical protein